MEPSSTSVAQAYETLRCDPSAVYLDVRTEGEFAAGHPSGARNVPVLFFDPATRRPTPNADFLAVVEANFPRTAKLLVGCQSGMRSQRACELLLEAGYAKVVDVAGGFGGMRDATGIPVAPGWEDSGLPIERGQTAGACYADLQRARR